MNASVNFQSVAVEKLAIIQRQLGKSQHWLSPGDDKRMQNGMKSRVRNQSMLAVAIEEPMSGAKRHSPTRAKEPASGLLKKMNNS